ncbi:sensor histidine kinase [Thermoactinospora rubra]|uniref:sensor histidine kinase n=1 Tax=Thermoactinospora rubra TaxID=1088767 RepID=UPI001302050C|nr:histidine kinase [Thermoactinospora rubra]
MLESWLYVLPPALAGGLLIALGGLAIAPGILARTRAVAVVKERRRIALNLHDGVGHGLVVLAMHARGLLASPVEGTDRRLAALIDDTAQATLADLRETLGVLRSDGARGLPPGEEARKGRPFLLSARLVEMAGRLPAPGVAVRLSNVAGEHRVPADVAHTAYRVAQEALTNALRHGSQEIALEVDFGPDLSVSVTNRPGAPEGSPRGLGGSGLAGLRERVAVHGGRLHCGPRPGGRFVTRTIIPLAPDRLPEEDACERSAC